MANTKKPESDKPTKASKPTDKQAAKPKKSLETGAEVEAAAKSSAAKKAAPKGKKSGTPARRPLMPKTYFAKPGEQKNRWRLVDASKQPLGRLSTHLANMLMGKDKPGYTRFIDTGDFIVVINADKVLLTGNKLQQKEYYSHSNFPGGLRTTSAAEMLATHPERVIEKAVWRMLPKDKKFMTRRWFSKLRVFAGGEHPHQAQQPELVKLPNLSTRKEA